jgi:hypothetical protein
VNNTTGRAKIFSERKSSKKVEKITLFHAASKYGKTGENK